MVYTMDYHSSLKRKAILTDVTTRNNLEDIMLGEKSQSQKAKYCMILFTEILRELKTERYKAEECLVGGDRAWGRNKRE